jgi:uncharacterized membrane protein YobD (UPF0266 family)
MQTNIHLRMRNVWNIKCRENLIFIKFCQKQRIIYMKSNIHFRMRKVSNINWGENLILLISEKKKRYFIWRPTNILNEKKFKLKCRENLNFIKVWKERTMYILEWEKFKK